MDPQRGGTNNDKSTNEKYCSFCFQDGKFYDEGITLQEKIEKNVQLAVSKFNMSEEIARKNAESILPLLERWK
jgi:hypothetical protein